MFDLSSITYLQFGTSWLQLRLPCLCENASIVLQLGFLGFLLLYCVWKTVLSLGKNNTSAYSGEKYKMDAIVGLSYKVCLVCSILLLGSLVATLFMPQSKSGTECKMPGPILTSEILQAIVCAITLIALYKVKKDKCGKYPLFLRIWWMCSFIMSLAKAVLEAHHALVYHSDITILNYIDFFALIACTCLLVISVRGKTGIVINLPNGISEPLLNGDSEKNPDEKRDCPYGKATLLQLVTFSWLNQLFAVGIKKPLDQDEVPDVDIKDSAGFLSHSFDESLNHVRERYGTAKPSIYKAIYSFGRKKAVINAFFAVISAVASYVGPYLISDLVTFLNEKNTRSLKSGYLLALGFLSAKIVETVAQRQWIFGARQLGLRVRAALIAHIYKKGLVLSSQSCQKHTSGEIINYMSVDIQRITDFMWYINIIWMLPIQISLAILILHTNLGMGSMVALAATMVVMMINIPMTKIQKGYQSKIMEAKDDRMKSTSEILRNMKTLKLQAWDSHYLRKLESLRKTEYKWLWKSLRLQAITAFIFWGSPTFISVLTFGGCVLMGIPLTAGRVLSALATFRMLQDPIFNLPDLLNVIAQGKVSADRIASYLQEEEIQTGAVQYVSRDESEFDIEIEGGKFSWDFKSSRATLDGIELKVKRGMKVAICGTVGSGKSSLLSSILGEVTKVSGTVKVSGTKAYVPQSPWILTGNVRENILFGNSYDSTKYDRTIQACALVKDFELFSTGDLTEIGERGKNMSGGQKQRIQIARAVYDDADIYLLDDPFSAVDAHTGRQLFEECLMGILKEKTILYVTHQVEFLPAADLILVMQNGRIAQAGTFEELMKQNIGFEVLVGAHSQALDSVLTVETASRATQNASNDGELTTEPTPVDEFPHTKQDSEHNLSVEINEKEGRLVNEEEREKGSIGKEVYLSYLTIVKGGALVPIILLAQSSFQVLQIASNYWMAWACPTDDAEKVTGMNYILFIYVLFSVGSSLCVLLRASLVAITGLAAAEKLFHNMLHSVLRAPMAFFDSTPFGRILNRASTDQSVLDLEIANRIGWCAFSIIQIIGTITVMSQVAWEVFIIFIPVTAICIWYQKYYIPTARELARLSGIERAPILHHFAESLSGAATIRAFDQKRRFTDANLCLVDNHSRPWFHNVAAMEWLSFRLNQLSNFVFAFSLVLLISLPEGIIDPSIAGLAVTYGINLNVLQASVIWNICNAENKMISVERILQYSNITSEAPLVIEDSRPPNNWPETGTIRFKNLQIRYAEHLPSVLKNITCTIPGKKKVGVVGRTGSGKSTLIQAIFRVVEPREGSIIIDNIDICKIGLHDLRSNLSIIPQDPTMFEGTVRGNLDPLQQYSDTEIWEALDKCQLGDTVRAKDEKLDYTVVENGENWSVGQRQLFCLGRALLKKSCILVLDEATASVDSATDGILQKIISQEFKDRTILTIAHRIHTVIDSDFVLVLSDGRIAEYDTPARLLERDDSFFSKLIREYSMSSQSLSNLAK
ncbi:hypothetical protein DCAR_0101303 [Daucus carota subsp. sativus]|uniref:ABC-type xenobiotic transporter n=2 Tax=Daucus carota subsp. sativus TaxID=79200 RepID=A0AAF1AJ59_DAUCS|nr:PREDICTED: putative ABC transporter C family member 15 isoform X2 [Daucus carota subsp. sativus]XP_017228497.1 PREDICTED: putative ABC transporter C family member 15 isoform X2 [Daucus carota subsp. sativus]XP_017228500.1 PREDICTED: putative ABC transporter C family member 15 isoform X2 [Daucus carota subsp. sativus]WOG82141.1 hypothetical protein DCAR_0101303 [Daucus carota subsp. sativus]